MSSPNAEQQAADALVAQRIQASQEAAAAAEAAQKQAQQQTGGQK